MNYNSYLDPAERKLMEIMPIESQESEKRNNFRTKLNHVSLLFDLFV